MDLLLFRHFRATKIRKQELVLTLMALIACMFIITACATDRAAKNEKADLILLDIILPGKDGIDICRDLRKAHIETPILMLTSKKEEIDKVLSSVKVY